MIETADTPSLTDGRQSPRALLVRRGVGRLLSNLNFTFVPEITLPDGRRADLMALGPKGEIWIIEIKSSVADFRADTKWEDYQSHCDCFFFATMPDVTTDIFPQEIGLLISDGYGAEIIRDACLTRLNPSTRKALTLRFARFASSNLNMIFDPGHAERSVT